MNSLLENYLTEIEKNLKSIPVSERMDILNELKSYIAELQMNEKLSDDDILKKLGSAKQLSAGYLCDYLDSNATKFKKMMVMISFWSVASIGGMFIIPCGLVLSIGLVISSAVSILSGIIKLLAFMFHIDLPFIAIQFPGFSVHPLSVASLAIVFGVLLYFAGKYLWKSVFSYIKIISKHKEIKHKL